VKVESAVFGIVAVFLAGASIIYYETSGDPTGTTALTLAFGLAFLLWFYLFVTSRRLVGPRPEDRGDAEVADGAGELGFFSPHSWWPLIAAASAALTSMGLFFGWWLTILGAGFLIYGVLGFLFEYYHHEPQHDEVLPGTGGH
jgi:hypothetical protein